MNINHDASVSQLTVIVRSLVLYFHKCVLLAIISVFGG